MIFLSASIPNKQRDPKYFETADVIAIRDAVRALATVIIPRSHLVWGGHPAITPLIQYVMKKMDVSMQQHVTMYMSKYYKAEFPAESKYFQRIVLTETKEDKDASLLEMRHKMLSSGDFVAGVFIGGMNGVEDEFEMFRDYHPHALRLPVASTGGAAKIIYDKLNEQNNRRLLNDYAYMDLFKSLLHTKLDL